VNNKTFREDLYYRLNVIPIKIPALRQRRTDVPLLIDYFLKQFNETKRKDVSGIHPAALEILTTYHWPGNVRELENLVERLVILKARGVIEVRDLPERYQQRH